MQKEKPFKKERVQQKLVKLYFCTARGKDFYKQLKNQPYVAIAGMNKEVRLNGPVKRLENQKYWIDRIFKHNSSMNDVYPNESRYILEAFCLEEGELEFFDLGKEPIYRESFSMNKEIKPKGFIISNQCIQCGLCQKNCPQQCISNYQIQQFDTPENIIKYPANNFVKKLVSKNES